MKSELLLAIINGVEKPSKILDKLSKANFEVTGVTDEGDSILHLLAKSNHAKTWHFSEYLKTLMTAGADVNAVDKEGHTFLSYYLEHGELSSVNKTVSLLLEDESFDMNQELKDGQTFFEFICDSSNNSSHLLAALIKHKKFNPNQKTSKHNSILLHVAFENMSDYHRELLLKNKRTDPNIKNNMGQTVLAHILKNRTQYQYMGFETALINHEQCDINTVDQDGNSYLQLAVIHCEYEADEIAKRLIQKGIHVGHKNNAGQSVFDCILKNTGGRLEYENNQLLLAIIKLHPASLCEKDSDGKTILGQLLKSQDYFIRSQIEDILKLCKNQGNCDEFLKNIISECFNDFRQNLISQETIVSLTNALIKADINNIDIEYCLALTAIRNPFMWLTINNHLKMLKPGLDLKLVISHIENLTTEGSDEHLHALRYIVGRFGFSLNDFSDDTLALEERGFHSKTRLGSIEKDTRMFAHLFALDSSIPVNSNIIDLSGSFLFDTAPFMVHLMNAYVSHCKESGKHIAHLDAIQQVRKMTVKAMRSYFLSRSLNYSSSMQDDFLSSMIEDSQKSGVEILTGWPRHAINLIIKEDKFYRNNGGGCSIDTPTECYKIPSTQNITKEVLAKLYTHDYSEANKTYIQQDLHRILGLIFYGSIPGAFQTVGNCAFHSMLIALKVKYRLFLPEHIADELFADTVKFFKEFYLQEYLSHYSNNPVLPHLLMRFIIQGLIPSEQLELANQLLTKHFNSEANQEILLTEFMLERWRLRVNGQPTKAFDKQLESLGVVLDPKMNTRLNMLERFLNDKVTIEDLDQLKSSSLHEQLFQGYHLLHFAVMNNNVALASSLLEMFPQAVNQTNWYDQKPLCLVKSIEMIEILIKAGADITGTENNNPLDCAIKANRSDLVMALLQHDAQTSEYSAQYAAASQDPKILESLIKFHPGSITKPCHNYSISVHAAANVGHSANLHTLIYDGGATPDARDVNGVTPLYLALKKGDLKTASLLMKYPGTLFNSPYRGDSLFKMIPDKDTRKMMKRTAQERRADLDYFNNVFTKKNPGITKEEIDYLIVAIRTMDLSAIRGCLIAYPHIRVASTSNHYCTTPLTEIIQKLPRAAKGEEYNSVLEIIQMLLRTSGIDINAYCTATSVPILFSAVSIDNVDVLELFLADPKLNPNQQDSIGGYTALHDAVARGHLNCVKRLLQDERVDSTIVNKQGKTAADLGSCRFQCEDAVLEHQQQYLIKQQYLKQGNSLAI